MKKMANVCVVCISKPLPGSRSSNCILLQLHITKAPSVHLYMLLHSMVSKMLLTLRLTVYSVEFQKRYEDISVLGQRPAEE
jgi:hypothetical protein